MRPGITFRIRFLLAATLIAMLSNTSARGEVQAEIILLPPPVGPSRLILPPGVELPALVIMLPDALGEDGRSEAYVGSLLARGIGSVVLGLGEDVDHAMTALEPAASPDAVAPAIAWAQDGGMPIQRIGLMGFGLGGRAVLAAGTDRPVAALYPGCAGLPLPAAAPALVLQGKDRSEACAGLPPRAGFTLHLLAGAGHGWDAPGAIWPSPGPMLPDPVDPGRRLRARADLDATLMAAELVADWFEAQLSTGQKRAAR
jgi:dienelactone hydrolase